MLRRRRLGAKPNQSIARRSADCNYEFRLTHFVPTLETQIACPGEITV
jgi:hypothetical protein